MNCSLDDNSLLDNVYGGKGKELFKKFDNLI